ASRWGMAAGITIIIPHPTTAGTTTITIRAPGITSTTDGAPVTAGTTASGVTGKRAAITATTAENGGRRDAPNAASGGATAGKTVANGGGIGAIEISARRVAGLQAEWVSTSFRNAAIQPSRKSRLPSPTSPSGARRSPVH